MASLSSIIMIIILLAALNTGFAAPMCSRRSKNRPHPTNNTTVLSNSTSSYPVYSHTSVVSPTTTTTNVPVAPGVTSTQVASTPTSTPTSTPSTSATTGSTVSDIQTFLQSHNTIRAQHGAAPLVWSDTLAGKAQQWAARCEMVHSGGQLGDYGENLAAGTGSAYDIRAAVKSWTDEVSEYDPNNPVPSHFTQVVWKSTTQLGCAVQICNDNKIFDNNIYGPTTFVVCEYAPPGNVIGDFSQNVQA